MFEATQESISVASHSKKLSLSVTEARFREGCSPCGWWLPIREDVEITNLSDSFCLVKTGARPQNLALELPLAE
jgi:hypothetical protein